ncbi:MAG TPA: hypothetical protein VFX85_12135 [Solirubrobacterales bacterium]|nr:hypothetical protein [Solirubrobacterales bacterium]
MKKSIYAVLATALLAVIVMPIAFAGAAGKGPAKGNANVAKQLKALKQRVAALEGKPAPTIPKTLPPSGAAGGDLAGTYPNPLIAPNAVATAKLADAAVTEPKLADGAVTSAKLGTGAVQAANVGLDSVGSFALKGQTAVVGAGVAVSAGAAQTATVSCPAGQMVIAGGYAWTDQEANSIIASAPSEADPNQTWVVEGMVDAGSNTLFAWANCLTV